MIPAHDDSDPFVSTFAGGKFHPLTPRIDEVRIEDIAHALSLKCRYSGQCARFYSVAEHSVLVAALVEPQWRQAALLHDAGEAYLADLAWPLKRAPEFKAFLEVEDRILATVYARFGVSTVIIPEAVRKADRLAQELEWPDLMYQHGIQFGAENVLWGTYPNMRFEARRLPCLSPEVAKKRFLQAFKELFPNEH